ncbi:hypothetical protein OG216_47915 (plasmid) [Streptomycetaceae bacterium NBC_01309]
MTDTSHPADAVQDVAIPPVLPPGNEALFADFVAVRGVVDDMETKGATRFTAMRVLGLCAAARPEITYYRVVALLDFMADAGRLVPLPHNRYVLAVGEDGTTAQGQVSLELSAYSLTHVVDVDDPHTDDVDVDVDPAAADLAALQSLADDLVVDGRADAELRARIGDLRDNHRAADSKAGLLLATLGIAATALPQIPSRVGAAATGALLGVAAFLLLFVLVARGRRRAFTAHRVDVDQVLVDVWTGASTFALGRELQRMSRIAAAKYALINTAVVLVAAAALAAGTAFAW